MYLVCIDFRKIIFFRWKNMIAYFPPSPSIFSISITTFFFLPIFSNFIITNQFFSLFSSISATLLPQFFFLYSNFGNLAATIPFFPSGHSHNHLGSFGQLAFWARILMMQLSKFNSLSLSLSLSPSITISLFSLILFLRILVTSLLKFASLLILPNNFE